MNDLIRQIRDSIPEDSANFTSLDDIAAASDNWDETLAKAVAEKCAELASKYDEKAGVEIRLRFGVGK